MLIGTNEKMVYYISSFCSSTLQMKNEYIAQAYRTIVPYK